MSRNALLLSKQFVSYYALHLPNLMSPPYTAGASPYRAGVPPWLTFCLRACHMVEYETVFWTSSKFTLKLLLSPHTLGSYNIDGHTVSPISTTKVAVLITDHGLIIRLGT